MKQAEVKNSFFRKFKPGMSATVVLTALLVGCILDSSVNQAPPDPRIFLQTPSSMVVLNNGRAILAVHATGHDTTLPLQYKWVSNNTDTLPDSVMVYAHNGGIIETSLVSSTIFGDFVQGLGYTSDTLVIDSVTAAKAGPWKCVVRNSHGIAVTEPVTINVIDLPPATRRLYELGEARYQENCINCHGPDGRGGGEVTPPLNPSDYVMADSRRFIRLQLIGVPNFIDSDTVIVVNGRSFKNTMESKNDNDSITAGILTYVRVHFNGAVDSVTPELVAIVRDSLAILCAQHMSQNPNYLPCAVDTTH